MRRLESGLRALQLLRGAVRGNEHIRDIARAISRSLHRLRYWIEQT